MSRDSEKVLKELQKFLDAHAEDTENEADVDALAERFFAEYNLKCKEQKGSAPETADDYLDLAEQVTSKKKRVEYLHKALGKMSRVHHVFLKQRNCSADIGIEYRDDYEEIEPLCRKFLST